MAEFICKNCGRAFKSKPTTILNFGTFCGLQCRLDLSEKIIGELRRSGRPLIEVGDSSISCLVCGKHLKALGDHFLTHGLTTRGLTNQERNLIFGLCTGSRSCPNNVRQQQSERATKQGNFQNKAWTEKGRDCRTRIDWDRVGELRSMLPQPVGVITNLRRQAHLMHERACMTIICSQCKSPFSKPKSHPSKRCPGCRRSNGLLRRGIVSRP